MGDRSILEALSASPVVSATCECAEADQDYGSRLAVNGLALFGEVNPLAYILEGLALASLGGLVFGRFCQGAYLYLHLTGQSASANRTLPWSA
jgi:hypothetical protein